MIAKTKHFKAKIKAIKKIKPDVFSLNFNSPYLAKQARPGQFLHLKINRVILRRPFSLHQVEGNQITILFRVRGRGTKSLSQTKAGKYLDIIGPLGKGFNYKSANKKSKRQILLAGGIGVAPLVFLAQKIKQNKNLVLLGAKNKKEILAESKFKKLGCKVLIATDDGSRGYKGSVTNLLKNILKASPRHTPDRIYACGPQEMFFELNKVLKKYPKANCQVSFEQFMGCGLGVCCACVIETKKEYKKVCKDGPVFAIRDIW